mmetsp:Transcript_107710/g.304697  ORF Transcript_107710/g.304697 Transcript_107710/m.304697 type:complete len:327 (+) Transcript_107710:326-1306(+)
MKEPTMTANGTTSRATCVAEPTAMPMARPGRSCMAKRMAPACSQALPAMGRRMTPMNVSGMPAVLTTFSRTPTRMSELTDVTMVQTSMSSTAQGTEMLAASSSSSSASSTPSSSAPRSREPEGSSSPPAPRPFSSCDSVLVCVSSWKTRKAPYEDMTIQAPTLDTSRTLSLSVSWTDALKIVGRANDMQEKSSIAMLMSALLIANFCSFSMPMTAVLQPWKEWNLPRLVLLGVSPPRRNALPSTSRMLDSTEPSSESLTTERMPFRRACTETIISTALPKLALRRPLIVSLCSDAASSSVASPRILANGIKARKLNQKDQESPQSR